MKKRLVAVLAALALVSACASTGGVEEETDSTTTVSAAQNEAETEMQDQNFADNAQDRVYFGFDRANLDAEAVNVLKAQADWLKANPEKTVTVQGHTDDRGTREYNLALGERRAVAVKNYLLSRGISPDRIEVISYGKERPAVVGANEAAWAQNRRAVSVVK